MSARERTETGIQDLVTPRVKKGGSISFDYPGWLDMAAPIDMRTMPHCLFFTRPPFRP